MPEPNEFSFTVGEAVWTFADETAAEETAVGSRFAEYEYPKIDGVEVSDLGNTPRNLVLTAWLHAADEAGLQALKDAIDAARGQLGTLAIRGGADSWTNVLIWGQPKYSRRIPPQADGTVHCRVQLVFRQLIPA